MASSGAEDKQAGTRQDTEANNAERVPPARDRKKARLGLHAFIGPDRINTGLAASSPCLRFGAW